VSRAIKILAVAAVIGRDFQLEVLQRVAGVGDDELFAALEEARKMAVVEERTGVGARVSYRFAHAFFRSTLYEEIIAPKRIRLHRQVAQALEEVHKNRLEEHAAELAEHFSYSSDSADLEKSISYGQMAAKRATAVYAFGEAVRLLEQALGVQEILDPGDKARRCDLLLELGWARHYAHEMQHVLDSEAPIALSLAEELEDGERACGACLLATYALGGSQSGLGGPEAANWVEAYDRHAPPDTVHRAWADCITGWTKEASGDMAGALALFRESTLLARKLGDASAFTVCGMTYLIRWGSVFAGIEEGRQLAEEIKRTWDKADVIAMVAGRLWVGSFLLSLGERQEAEGTHRELLESARFARLPILQYIAPAVRACYQIMDGQLEEAAKSHDSVLRIGVELGAPIAASNYASWSGRRLSGYLGWGLEGLKRLEERARMSGQNVAPLSRAYYLACVGQVEEATAALDGFVEQYATDPNQIRHFWLLQMLVLETAVLAGHARAAEILMNLLEDTPTKTTGLSGPTCVARHLGGAAALLGRHEEARKYYQEAIKVCTEMRFRPELALTRLQLAELILEHYPDDKREAVEHLAFCIPEFRDMKMQPWLERALRHKEILKA
jgi:eukaryotic-like serine/threonine-protein kinase